MSQTFLRYELSELLNGTEGLVIRTLAGTEITISVEHNRTYVLFPLGNQLDEPEKWGRLSEGVVAIDIERHKKPR